MKRNPFAEDTTVKTDACLRVRVVAIDGDTVTLAQEFSDDEGNLVTLAKEIGIKAGGAMLLRGLTVSLAIEKEPA
jgi:hypothetical protein